ncbi:MAG: ester cyclase [Bacteroidota bacterium]
MVTENTQDISHLANAGPCIDFMFAYTEHDVDKMLSYCDPTGTVHFKPLGEDGRGQLGELGRHLWSALVDAFPDLVTRMDSSQATDDTIRCQVLIEGTQAKDFAGIKAQGKRFSSDHIFVFRLNESGKIDQLEVEWDHADFSRQLQA